MHIFSRKFWQIYRHDPKELIDSLTLRKSRFIIHLVKFTIFIRVLFSEYLISNCFTRASALAYVLLLTIIPLVVSAAFMMKSLNEVEPEMIKKTFSFLLPFAPPTILDYLSTFFENAQKIKGIGIGILIIMTVGLFGTVEDSLNTIWKVSHSRSFFIRLRTFTMMIVYSPLLFLASSQVRKMVQIRIPDFPMLSSVLAFLLIVLAFASLIFFVPNTKVRYTPALIAGLIAGFLFEFERRSFNTYVALSMQTQTIYGTFGILTFFLISLFIVSLIILFGAELAYVIQNFRPLLRAKKRWDRRISDYRTYITLRMMTDCVSAYMKKKTAPSLSYFANRYELTEAQAEGLLKWLIHEGFIHNISNKDAYVPTRDFSSTPVIEVIEAIEDQSRKIPTIPADYTRDLLASLILNHNKNPQAPENTLTFAGLIEYIDMDKRKKAAKIKAMKSRNMEDCQKES